MNRPLFFSEKFSFAGAARGKVPETWKIKAETKKVNYSDGTASFVKLPEHVHTYKKELFCAKRENPSDQFERGSQLNRKVRAMNESVRE